MAVIGFLDYPDFLDEITDINSGEVIRVQSYRKMVQANEFITDFTFFVEIAVEINRDVYTCRFKIGSVQIISNAIPSQKAKLDKLHRWSQRGAALIRKHLVDLGFVAAPGLIAMNYQHEIITEWPELWSEQGLDRVDGADGQEAAA